MISCIFQIMLPGFSWYNFITNALHLALRVPDDPNILGQFLTRVTGHQFVMVDTNTNGDQVNSNPISSDSTSPSPGIKQSDQTVRSGVDVTDSNPIPPESIPPGADTERSKLDDDDHSYQSCASAHGDDDVLFDCGHTFRFPQGDQPSYVVNDPKFKLSWTMMTYGYGRANSVTGERTLYQCCLGIYKCPQPGCKFVSNAVAPRKNRAKGAQPRKSYGMFGSGQCVLHSVTLIHVPCTATCTIICSKTSVTVKHFGLHKHDHPHERVSKKAVARLDEIVRMNDDAKPMQILQGTPTRDPARALHPALNNLDRISYFMRQAKSKMTLPKLQDLGEWQKTIGYDFLKKADLQAGIIVIQFPGMMDIAQNNVLYAFQTDTIEGWMYEQNNHSWNVTVTSTHSVVLGRHVPVLMSVTKQRTAVEYKSHFNELFNCLQYQTLSHFQRSFPGNISDFSAAEQSGFRDALTDYFNASGDCDYSASDIAMDDYYKFCNVSTVCIPMSLFIHFMSHLIFFLRSS